MFLVVKHPITNTYINLFNDKLNDLINNGYTIQDIINLSKQIPHYYNRENIFTNDLLINYMNHLELIDILSLLLIDKHALSLINDGYLWKIKINNSILTGFKFNQSYNLDNYKKCIYANKRVQQFSILKHNQFGFNPHDDLSKVTGPSKKYHVNKFESQNLIFSNNTLQFAGLINGKEFKSGTLNYPIDKQNNMLFNIFFYYPNVKHIYW